MEVFVVVSGFILVTMLELRRREVNDYYEKKRRPR
jgi:hypothetical protein